MINNDYVEEYYRIENLITSNEETVFNNRAGEITFTIPVISSDVSISHDLPVPSNRDPETVNLVVDAITLFSSNPNVLNYMPIKFDMTQFQIELADPTLTVLDEYQVITDTNSLTPPVNLESVKNHRYSIETNYSNVLEVGESPVVKFIAEYGDSIYLIATVSGSDYVYFIKKDTRVLSPAEPMDSNVVALYSNDYQLIAVLESNLPDTVEIRDLLTGKFFTVPTYSASREFQVWLFDDYLVVISQNVAGDSDVYYYVKGDDEEYQLFFSSTNIFGVDIPIARFAFHNKTIFVGYCNTLDDIYEDFTDKLYVFNVDFDLGVILDRVIDFPNWLDFNDLENMYLGGDGLTSFSLTVTALDGTTNRVIRYFSYDDLLAKRPPKVYVFRTVTSEIAGQYLNQIYFPIDKNRFVSFNLDNGVPFVGLGSILRPDVNICMDMKCIWMGGPSFLMGGVSKADNQIITITRMGNSRSIDKVYKLVFDYGERVFPFQVHSKNFTFKIRLPDGYPVIDLELFKYVIDFRVRFSKRSKSTNPVRRVDNGEEVGESMGLYGKNRRRVFKRWSRAITMEKIYGAPVNQSFLDLYS